MCFTMIQSLKHHSPEGVAISSVVFMGITKILQVTLIMAGDGLDTRTPWSAMPLSTDMSL